MSREIDERVVSMKFENEQFESGIRQSERSVSTFNNTLNSMGSRGAALGSIANSVDAISSRFSALGIIGMTALQNIANKAVDTATQLVKAFTIQPVSQGFQEYELKMGSVQTIMASTGASLQEVNGYLGELNDYADRTIYSFSDMTNSIGKFTNAGVSLDKAVLAIKGISNEAAVSGANASQASHAMYNFAQALSAGYVKLIDWKSIENAQMATVEFKNELIDTAVKMGNLEKQADGTYKVLTKNGNGAAMKETISATKNFNDSLAYQWMTTDVLIDTLGRYADETTAIGKKAYASAQDIKTFSMMMDTLKEATGSGWAETFEIVFGNFEESKELWTSLGNTIGDFIKRQADARNTMLQSWKTLGGRDDILAGLKWSFRGLGHIIGTISEAFENTFGRLRLYSLYKLSEGFKNLGLSFNVGVLKNLSSIKDIFSGVFSGIHIFTQAISAAFKAVVSAIKFLAPAGKSILEFAASIGRGITALDQFITKNQVFERLFSNLGNVVRPIGEVLRNAFTGLLDVLQSIGSMGVSALSSFMSSIGKIGDVGGKLSGIFSGVGNVISKALDGIITVFSKVGQAIGGFIKGVVGDLSVMDGLMAVVLTGSATKFVSFIKSLKSTSDEARSMFDVIKKAFMGFGEIPNKIGEVLGSAKDAIKAFVMDLNARALLKIAGAIGVLAVALNLISKLDVPSLTKGLAGIGIIMAEMIGFMTAFSKLGSLKGITAASLSLISLGTALILISGAMKVLSTMSWEGIAKGLVGVAGALVGIAAATRLMPAGGKMLAIAPALLAIASAMVILSGALKVMGSMSIESIGHALLVLGGSLGELAIGLHAMNGTLNGSAALVAASAALMLLAPALKLLGTMDNDSIAHSLITLAGALMVLSVAATAMKGSVASMAGVAASLGVLGASLLLLGPALKILGSLSWEGIAKGLATIAGAFLELGIAGKVLGNVAPQMILVSAALGVLGAALLLFAPALAALGSLKTETIVKGLVALAATFGILGVAGLLLGPVTPVLLALSVAIGVFGAAVLAVGAGVALFGAGLTALAALTAPALENIGNALKTVISTIPEFATAVAEGLVNTLQVLAQNAPQVVSSIITLLKELLTQLATLIPEMAELGLQMITALLTGIRDHIQEIVEIGMEIITGFLRGIAEHIEEVVDAGLDIVKGIIKGIAENAKDLATEAGHLVAEFIRGLGESAKDIMFAGADFVRNLGQGISEHVNAIGDCIGDIITAFINSVSEQGDRIRTAGKDAIIKFINGLGECAVEISNAATDVIVMFCEALGKNAGLIMWAVSNLFKQIKSAFATEFPMLAEFLGIEAEEVSWEFPERYAQGVYSRKDVATGAVDNVGLDIKSHIAVLKDKFGPDASAAGTSVPTGVGSGVSSSTGTATSAVQSMGSSVASSISSLGSQFNSAGSTSGAQTGTGTASGVEGSTGHARGAIATFGTNCANALKNAGTALHNAGSSAGQCGGQGLVSGLNGMIRQVVAAAGRLAAAAASAMNAALQVNSPSKVTMRIGNSVGEGFAMGIDKMVPAVEKSSRGMAQRTIDAAKKLLKINSPSKVAKDEIGNYIVEGIAEGIEKNTSAEDAAAKKAQNIINAFKAELEKADFSQSINKLNYDIWSGLNMNATPDVKNQKALELAEQELAAKKQRLDLLKGQLDVIKKEFGEDSQYYKDALKEELEAEKAYIDALTDIKTLRLDTIKDAMGTIDEKNTTKQLETELWSALNPNADVSDKTRTELTRVLDDLESKTDRINLLLQRVALARKDFGENTEEYKSAYNDLLKEIKEYADGVTSLKTTYSTLAKDDRDINKAITRWALNNQDTMIILKERMKMSDDAIREYIKDQLGLSKENETYSNAIRTFLSDSEKFIKTINEALKSGNLENIEQLKTSIHYSDLLAESVAKNGKEVTAASEKVADSTVTSVSDKSDEMKDAGATLMQTLTDSITTEGQKAVEAAKGVATAITQAVSTAVSSNKTLSDMAKKKTYAVPVRTSSGSDPGSSFGPSATAAAIAKTYKGMSDDPLSKLSDTTSSKNNSETRTVVNHYNLTQNNSSPKSLSNADIYRKTKTLLSTTKIVSSKGAAVTA